MSVLDRSLDLFERHKYGVIGTLLLHTLFLFLMAISSVGERTPAPGPEPIALELEAPPPEPKPEEQAQAAEHTTAQDVTNQTSNTTAATSQEPRMSRRAQEQMAAGVEQDLQNLERQEFERLAAERTAQGKDIVVPTLDTTKFDKRNYMQKPTKPVKVEGLTTVSYDLVGRTDIILEVPAYLCKGSGKITIKVAVDRSGAVSKAELDPSRSSAAQGCMAEHALTSAAAAQFSSAPAAAQPQRGTITYIFMAQ